MLSRAQKAMSPLHCHLPRSLRAALDARHRETGESIDHLVRAALSRDPGRDLERAER